MKLSINSERLAIVIIAIAIFIFAGTAGYKWYSLRGEHFLSGAPPKDILNKIEPKSVPYELIKPPPITPADIFLLGSPTSSLGITFYGDYTDPVSNALLQQTLNALKINSSDVRLTYHYLPKSTEDNTASFEAAILSECSRLIDPYWSAHQILSQQFDKSFSSSDIKQLSFEIMDVENMLYACQRDESLREKIRTDADTARGDGIDTAPFVFVVTQAIPSSQATIENISNALKNFKQ